MKTKLVDSWINEYWDRFCFPGGTKHLDEEASIYFYEKKVFFRKNIEIFFDIIDLYFLWRMMLLFR